MNDHTYLISYIKSILLLSMLFTHAISAQVPKKIIHPLMGSLSFSVSSGVTIPFTDYNESRIGFIWKGSVDHYFNTYSNQFVSIKAFGGTGFLNGKDDRKKPAEFNTSISFFGAGINYGYRIEENFFPSFFAGLSYLHFNPKDINGNKLPNNQADIYSKNDVNINFDIGLQYLVSDKVSINLNTGIYFNLNDWLDDVIKGKNNDSYYTLMLGISYFLISDSDNDNDGVPNSIDLCPDTKEGVSVDEFGCPIDSDHDNIPDYLDNCSNTPAGVKVDNHGCPLDSDQDGIPDFWDRCPNTPKSNTGIGCFYQSTLDY